MAKNAASPSDKPATAPQPTPGDSGINQEDFEELEDQVDNLQKELEAVKNGLTDQGKKLEAETEKILKKVRETPAPASGGAAA